MTMTLYTPSERDARLSLAWALRETCIRVHAELTWDWRDHLAQLEARVENMAYSFHVAADRRGARKIRIAVLKAYADHGKATWEAPIPEGADGVEARK